MINPFFAWTIVGMVYVAKVNGMAIDFWTGGPLLRSWASFWMSNIKADE